MIGDAEQFDPGAAYQRELAVLWLAHRDQLAGTASSILEKVSVPNAAEAELTDALEGAHRLAGTLGIFGLPDAAAAAREIELLLVDARSIPPATVAHLRARAQWLHSRILGHAPTVAD